MSLTLAATLFILVTPPNPKPLADAAPLVIIIGMAIYLYLNWVCDAKTVKAELPVFTIVYT
jgi:hypothetical protein